MTSRPLWRRCDVSVWIVSLMGWHTKRKRVQIWYLKASDFSNNCMFWRILCHVIKAFKHGLSVHCVFIGTQGSTWDYQCTPLRVVHWHIPRSPFRAYEHTMHAQAMLKSLNKTHGWKVRSNYLAANCYCMWYRPYRRNMDGEVKSPTTGLVNNACVGRARHPLSNKL